MGYAVTANSVMQVTLRGTLFNQTVMNTFHYRVDSGGGVLADGAAALSQMNDALGIPDSFYDTYQRVLPPQVVNIIADLQWIDPDRFVKRTFPVWPLGTGAFTATTPNLSAVLELRGDIADKRSIGTKHIPGLGGVAVAGGLVQAALLADLEEFGQQARLPQTVGGRTMTPIVFGRARAAYTDKFGVLHPAIGKSYRPITEFTVQTTARVMRRRTVGLGI